MRAEPVSSTGAISPFAEQKRKGLRVALAVSAGFTFMVASGAIVPFLAPLFAAQFLLASSSPMPLGKIVGMAALILVAGIIMMFLTVLMGDRPLSFLLLLGLIYFLCFFAQATAKGGPATFLVLVVAVMVPLLGLLNAELASSILSILVLGVIGGAILMMLAYALLPAVPTHEAGLTPPPLHPRPVRRALADTAILLLSVVLCLTRDGLSTALVVPITVISLLNQLDMATNARAAIGLVIVNLLGGVVALLGYGLLQIEPSLLFIFLITLVTGLVFGGRAAASGPSGQVYAGALTIFLILFGVAVSPLPGSAAESFTTRISYVAGAIVYTLVLAALLWPARESTGNNLSDERTPAS
ncbi:MAG: DUF2955 domain-containing protein [Phyllobacterium sp.]